MRPDILIVGQGLAGTLLAWEFERAGISFAIADPGHEESATRLAAGIVNPITGRRLVPGWRIETLLPAARETYRELEAALGVPLWREMRIRRFFANERERQVAAEKFARGEFGPFVAAAPDNSGFWIDGAARMDLAALLAAARERWRAQGRLRPEKIDVRAETGGSLLVVDCTGACGARCGAFDFVPWEFSKGEILALAIDGLDSDIVLNRGHWVLPLWPGAAWVGATHEPDFSDSLPSAAGRAALESAAAALLQRPFAVTGHFAGVRVNLPDKRPLAGRDPRDPRIGLVNGLGAKGTLWAPMLARQWVNHLTEGVPFEAEIAVDRFVRGGSVRVPAR